MRLKCAPLVGVLRRGRLADPRRLVPAARVDSTVQCSVRRCSTTPARSTQEGGDPDARGQHNGGRCLEFGRCINKGPFQQLTSCTSDGEGALSRPVRRRRRVAARRRVLGRFVLSASPLIDFGPWINGSGAFFLLDRPPSDCATPRKNGRLPKSIAGLRDASNVGRPGGGCARPNEPRSRVAFDFSVPEDGGRWPISERPCALTNVTIKLQVVL
uniref:Uncharacterized protein n=1 Tax=Trichuris muris TaxID=70415 RepID=A0A5S6QQ41_TRIMR